ncbi:MAG TPA: hypothetical protein DIU37_00295 [Opitutae bacterium]|nr:hypothetical protein [Opitutae bacterium]
MNKTYQKNTMKALTLALLAVGTMLPSPAWAGRAGAARRAQRLAEKAAQQAMQSDSKGAIDSLNNAQDSAKLVERVINAKSTEEINEVLKETVRIHEKNIKEAERPKKHTVNEESKARIEAIYQKICNRRYSDAYNLQAEMYGTLREGVIQDIVSDYRDSASTKPIGWQITHANMVKFTEEGFVDHEEFNYSYLELSELIELFTMVQNLEKEKGNQALVPSIVDMKDKLVRIAYDNEASRQKILKTIDNSTECNRHLKSILNNLPKGRLDFYPLVDKSTGEEMKHLDHISFDPATKPANKGTGEKIVIFQAAYEAPNVRMGGLGAFLKSFSEALNQYDNFDLRFITQFFDFLKKEYPNAEFKGFVDHQVYGKIMRSSIYQINSNGIKQYLIKPDPKMARIFDVGRPQNIYKAFSHAEYNPKMAYFNSALATLAATFRGEDGNNSVDILHTHSWHTGLAAALMSEKLNPLREMSGLNKISILNTIHMHGPEQGIMDANIFVRVGLELPKDRQHATDLLRNNIYERPTSVYENAIGSIQTKDRSIINYDLYGDPVVLGILQDIDTTEGPIYVNEDGEELEIVNLLIEVSKHADYMNTVSDGLKADMTDPNLSYGVHEIFQAMGGNFGAVLNGLKVSIYDPRKQEVLGKYAVKEDLSNLAAQKKAAKAALYHAGIITDPSKPLFLYVGRFGAEKGIDYLPAIANEVHKQGGQMLVMGFTPYELPESIKKLQSMQGTQAIKVYTNLQDQLQILAGTDAKAGMLARFAAEYTVIPSKLESCGLVALEALCMGSFLASSNVQGLKSICHPFDDDDAIYEDENCIQYAFLFEDDAQTQMNIQAMVERCFIVNQRLSHKAKEDIQKFIINDSKKFDWNYNENGDGPINKYINIFYHILNQK